MALEYFYGFDLNGSSGLLEAVNSIGGFYEGFWKILNDPARFGNFVHFSSSSGYYARAKLPNVLTHINFGMFLNVSGVSTSQAFFQLENDNKEQIINFRFDNATNRTIQIRKGIADTVVVNTGFAIPVSTWEHYQFLVKLDGANSTVQIRRNNTIMYDTTLDLTGIPTGGIKGFYIRHSGVDNCHFDDLYAQDLSDGSEPLGIMRCRYLFPVGPGDINEHAPNSGAFPSNRLVADDGDTSYIQNTSDSITQSSLFELQGLEYLPEKIESIRIFGNIKSVLGPVHQSYILKTNGQIAESDKGLNDGSYLYSSYTDTNINANTANLRYVRGLNLNPITGQKWQASELASLQVGIRTTPFSL